MFDEVDIASFDGEWNQTDQATAFGVEFQLTFNQLRLRNSVESQDLLCAILVDIMRHLHFNGNAALAQSMWCSLQANAIVTQPEAGRASDQEESVELPDNVSDLLSDERLTHRTRSIIQLDWNVDDWLQVHCFLERIMRYGMVWGGSLYSSGADIEAVWAVMSAASEREDDAARSQELTTLPGQIGADASGKATDAEEGTLTAHSTAPAAEETTYRSRLLNGQFIVKLCQAAATGDEEEDSRQLGGGAVHFTMMGMLAGGIRNPLNGNIAGQMAIFDVGEPSLVAVPYDPEFRIRSIYRAPSNEL